MRKYELLCIIRPTLDMDDVDQAIKALDDTIKAYGGSVLSTDKIGRKRLAYEIENFRDGFYVTLNIELPQDKVADLKRYMKLNENIIRELLLEKSKVKAEVTK